MSVDPTGHVPASTTAVTFNLTGNSATAPTFLTDITGSSFGSGYALVP